MNNTVPAMAHLNHQKIRLIVIAAHVRIRTRKSMVKCEIVAWIGSDNPYSPDMPEVHYILVRGSYCRAHWLHL
jgi:hypothetical protein